MSQPPSFLLLNFKSAYCSQGTSDKVYCAALLWCRELPGDLPPSVTVPLGTFGEGRFVAFNFYGRRESVTQHMALNSNSPMEKNFDATYGAFGKSYAAAMRLLRVLRNCPHTNVGWTNRFDSSDHIHHSSAYQWRVALDTTLGKLSAGKGYTTQAFGYSTEYENRAIDTVRMIEDAIGVGLCGFPVSTEHMQRFYRTFSSGAGNPLVWGGESTAPPVPVKKLTLAEVTVRRKRLLEI